MPTAQTTPHTEIVMLAEEAGCGTAEIACPVVKAGNTVSAVSGEVFRPNKE